MRLRVAIAAALACVLSAPVAEATPAQDLLAARDAFRAGACDRAMPLLEYLLYPHARLASTDDLVEAHLLFAACHFDAGNNRNATKEFEEALYLDMETTLDDVFFTKEAIEFFDDVKQRVKEKAEQDAINAKLAAERDAALQALANTVVIERRAYWINFLPLGAGQFQNGQANKGTAFFISEAVLGGTSMGIFLWQWQKYGFGGQVPREDAGLVRRMQQIQVGTGLAALALMAWGIVDALINYEPTKKVETDPSLLPPELRDALPKNEADSDASSLRLVPFASPHGGGLGLSLEF